MGPFDQSEKLPLNIQLPQSQLDFRRYTEYRHEESTICHSYGIKDSYNAIADHEKIESLEIIVASQLIVLKMERLSIHVEKGSVKFLAFVKSVVKVGDPSANCTK